MPCAQFRADPAPAAMRAVCHKMADASKFKRVEKTLDTRKRFELRWAAAAQNGSGQRGWLPSCVARRPRQFSTASGSLPSKFDHITAKRSSDEEADAMSNASRH